MNKSILLSITLFILSVVFSTANAKDILYPNIDGIGAESIGYSVLELALEKSGSSFNVVLDKREVNQDRSRRMVEMGQLDVFDTGFQRELEDRFDPIYLPLDRGILGWRLFIIHKDSRAELSKVNNISDLQKFVAGQGNGWGDIVILENAGLKVKTAAKIPNLIRMVGGKRFDIFPLGANEVFTFLEKFREGNPNLTVDENVVLVYPYGRFFFVQKGNTELAAAITKGMEIALKDGSLQAMLEQHQFFKDAFSKANLKNRVRIDIETPNLTEGFKSIDPKWWFTP